MRNKFRKTLSVIALSTAVLMGFAACGNTSSNQENSASSKDAEEPGSENAPETTESNPQSNDTAEVTTTDGKTSIVVYFSATGTTKGVAEKLAKVADADLEEIVPADPYTDEDLDYSDSSTRATQEQNDPDARPEIAGDPISLDSYDTVYLGYPIWWGEEPRIMDTFVESENFDGKTVVPFVTSSSSGIGSSGKNLEKLAGAGNWVDGERFDGGVSEDELKSWVDGIR